MSAAYVRLDRDDDIAPVDRDAQMRELDGLELTRRIRAHHPTPPVVIMTTLADDDERRRGLEAGAYATMTKHSFDRQSLVETLEQLIGR